MISTVLLLILLRYRYRPVTIDTIALPTVTVFCPTCLMVHQRYTSLRIVTHRFIPLPQRYRSLHTVTSTLPIVTDRYLTVTLPTVTFTLPHRYLTVTDR